MTAKFYSDLYANRSPSELDIDTFFDSVQPEHVLNADMQQRCEGLFTKEECFNAISNMKVNKAPGLDGLSIEFHTKLWPLIGDLMVEVFTESYKNGVLPQSQRSAVFSLIFKNGDMKDIANYRPISLTNVYYRTMNFVLAKQTSKCN